MKKADFSSWLGHFEPKTFSYILKLAKFFCNLSKYLLINFQIWFQKYNFKTWKYIKNVQVHSLGITARRKIYFSRLFSMECRKDVFFLLWWRGFKNTGQLFTVYLRFFRFRRNVILHTVIYCVPFLRKLLEKMTI